LTRFPTFTEPTVTEEVAEPIIVGIGSFHGIAYAKPLASRPIRIAAMGWTVFPHMPLLILKAWKIFYSTFHV
jgi:hypothetical protein